MKKEKLYSIIENTKATSAWNKGVREYAMELIDTYDGDTVTGESDLLNGAGDWLEYSFSGNSLIYDSDIAERLCTPGELERTNHGSKQPNARESWMEVQGRALYQASALILEVLEGQ